MVETGRSRLMGVTRVFFLSSRECGEWRLVELALIISLSEATSFCAYSTVPLAVLSTSANPCAGSAWNVSGWTTKPSMGDSSPAKGDRRRSYLLRLGTARQGALSSGLSTMLPLLLGKLSSALPQSSNATELPSTVSIGEVGPTLMDRFPFSTSLPDMGY